MKKIIAFALALCLTLLFPVSAFAAGTLRADEPVLVYRAEQITDPNQLMMRAQLEIDERSDEIRELTTVRAEWNDALLSDSEARIALRQIHTTTQLVAVETLPNGDRVEEYATAAVASGTYYGTESDSATQNSMTVFAMINYKYVVSEYGEEIRFGIQNTKHRVDYPSSVSVSRISLYNEIADAAAPRYTNEKTINSPVMGTWYQLNSPTSQTFGKMATTLYATTTAYASNGAEAEIGCVIDCKWFEPWA